MCKKILQTGILVAIICMPLHAQKKGYSPGYLVMPGGDTIRGLVKDRSVGTFTELYSRIRFKSEESLLRKRYSPDQIQGYACSDRIYASVPLREEASFFRFSYPLDEGNEKVFLRVMATNEALSYFHWEYMDEESNYLDHIPLFYRQGTDHMVRVTQGILGLKRKRLMEYFQDCLELVEAIEEKQVNEIFEVYDFYSDKCAGSSTRLGVN
jgi:hypothetical protein